MFEIYGRDLRLLRVSDKEAKTSGCHPARDVWPGPDKESPDVTAAKSYILRKLI